MKKEYGKLLRMLRKRNAGNAERTDAAIKRRYQGQYAVMITDSSHFTAKTKKYGIIHCLSLLVNNYDTLNAIIKRHSGIVVKEWADDIFAVFPDCDKALECGIEMRETLKKICSGNEADHFSICMGITFGEILFLGDEIFGDPVNTASKLGEDIASGDEILIDANVYERLRSDELRAKFTEPGTVELSDTSVTYYRFKG